MPQLETSLTSTDLVYSDNNDSATATIDDNIAVKFKANEDIIPEVDLLFSKAHTKHSGHANERSERQYLSCADIKTHQLDAINGVYTIFTAEGYIDVLCDNTDSGGWTLVYKIAGNSDMKSTNAVNAASLAGVGGLLETENSGKLSDTLIRELCSGSFKVEQLGSRPASSSSSYVPTLCEFDDISKYGDDSTSSKTCSAGVDTVRSDGLGFSTTNFVGTTIMQINQNALGSSTFDERMGSPMTNGYASTDARCTANGGCHTQVWCKPDMADRWATVFYENVLSYENDGAALEMLRNEQLAQDLAGGNYWVRMEWKNVNSQEFVQFKVPHNANIFTSDTTRASKAYQNIDVTQVHTSDDGRTTSVWAAAAGIGLPAGAPAGTHAGTAASHNAEAPSFGKHAHFCHACVNGTGRGGSCWALLPVTDALTDRACGCDTGSTADQGIYYSKNDTTDTCASGKGSFLGPKAAGTQFMPSGDHSSDFTIKVAPDSKVCLGHSRATGGITKTAFIVTDDRSCASECLEHVDTDGRNSTGYQYNNDVLDEPYGSGLNVLAARSCVCFTTVGGAAAVRTTDPRDVVFCDDVSTVAGVATNTGVTKASDADAALGWSDWVWGVCGGTCDKGNCRTQVASRTCSADACKGGAITLERSCPQGAASEAREWTVMHTMKYAGLVGYPTISVRFKDRAGNQASSSATAPVFVDTRVPAVAYAKIEQCRRQCEPSAPIRDCGVMCTGSVRVGDVIHLAMASDEEVRTVSSDLMSLDQNLCANSTTEVMASSLMRVSLR